MAVLKVIKEIWNGISQRSNRKASLKPNASIGIYNTSEQVFLEPHLPTDSSFYSMLTVSSTAFPFYHAFFILLKTSWLQSVKRYLVYANDGKRSANQSNPTEEKVNCWHYLSFECVNDELERLGLNTLNTFLYNMVSILIFHTFQNMTIQLFHHFILEKRLSLSLQWFFFPHPLNRIFHFILTVQSSYSLVVYLCTSAI